MLRLFSRSRHYEAPTHRVGASAVLALWLALSAGAAGAATIRDELSPKELDQLQQGEVLVRPLSTDGRPGSAFEVFKLMSVGLPALYSTLTCFQDYPQFMPNVARLDVAPQTGSTVVVDYYLDLPMNQHKRYRLRLQAEQAVARAQLRWQQIPWPGVALKDSIADTQGYWLLQAESPDKTWVKYEVYTDPGPIPFGFGWIVELLTRVSLPEVLRRAETRAATIKPSCLSGAAT